MTIPEPTIAEVLTAVQDMECAEELLPKLPHYRPDIVTLLQKELGCKLLYQRVNTLTFQLPEPLTRAQYADIKRITGAMDGEISSNMKGNMHTVSIRIPIILE